MKHTYIGIRDSTNAHMRRFQSKHLNQTLEMISNRKNVLMLLIFVSGIDLINTNEFGWIFLSGIKNNNR